MSEDVKDLLERATGWFEPTPVEPQDVVRGRTGRRSTTVVTAIVALALFAAAGGLTWTAFRPYGGAPPGSTQDQYGTLTLHGVTVRYPDRWTVVDLWPLASEIASWPAPVGTSIDIPSDAPQRGGLPVLQLSNVDLGLRSMCGSTLHGREAVLYVAANGGPYLLNDDGTARWGAEPTLDDGPCGRGWYAYRQSIANGPNGTSEERPYLVFAAFGPDVSDADRRQIIHSFDGLTFEPAEDFLYPPADASPVYATAPTRSVEPSTGPWGLPAVTVTPARGPVGTRIRIEGDGFTDRMWQELGPGADGYGVFLLGQGPGNCELIAQGEHMVDIDPVGHLTAELTVPVEGACFQGGRMTAVRPGRYSVGVGCHACLLATFDVAAGSVAWTPAASEGAFRACPSLDGVAPVSSDDAGAASAAVEAFLFGPDASSYLDEAGRANGLRSGQGEAGNAVLDAAVVEAGNRDLVGRACGRDVADRSFAVTVDDGTSSASLDMILFLVHRDTGWKVWGLY
ncbi:MAG: hypothetical protein ACXVPL_01845 [Actinomycetota bacterium]